jgi:uncharacterized protein (DUF2252 family)
MSDRSVIEEIARVNQGRKPRWVTEKYRRMRQDVFAFFRGTDHLFARTWASGARPIDPGPDVLICGDLHLENFGAYCAEDGTFLFDVNDFDEALVAPCGFDLTRCVASILLAADVWRLSPVQAERVALAYLHRYRAAVATMAEPGTEREMRYETAHGPVHKLLGRAAANTQSMLLASQTRLDKDGKPRIRRRGGLHPPVGQRRAQQICEAVKQYGVDQHRPDVYRVLDVSRRIAGIGSLGVRRYLALIHGQGAPDGYRIVDLKEATPSSVLPFLHKTGLEPWADDLHRVVDVQRILQSRPPAGLAPVAIDGRGYRMREMVPAENRTSLDQFRRSTSKLGRAVIIAGKITGWSHSRGARWIGPDRVAELVRWTNSAALDAVLASAVRHATHARRDYHVFCHAFEKYGYPLMANDR